MGRRTRRVRVAERVAAQHGRGTRPARHGRRPSLPRRSDRPRPASARRGGAGRRPASFAHRRDRQRAGPRPPSARASPRSAAPGVSADGSAARRCVPARLQAAQSGRSPRRAGGRSHPAHANTPPHGVSSPGLAVYSSHDGCTGNGHLRRQLRRHRQAAHRAAQDGRGQPLPPDLDRAPRGRRHPHQAAGHQPPAADDPRPAHQRHRQVRRRGLAHHGDRAQGEHLLRPAHPR